MIFSFHSTIMAKAALTFEEKRILNYFNFLPDMGERFNEEMNFVMSYMLPNTRAHYCKIWMAIKPFYFNSITSSVLVWADDRGNGDIFLISPNEGRIFIQDFEEVKASIINSYCQLPIMILNDDLNARSNNPEVNAWFTSSVPFMHRILWPSQSMNVIHKQYDIFNDYLVHNRVHLRNYRELQTAWRDCLQVNNIVINYSRKITIMMNNILDARTEDDREFEEEIDQLLNN